MELFKVLGTIALNGIDKFNEAIDDAAEKGNKLGDKIKKGLATVGKVGAALVGASAAATGLILKNSVQQYAQYEQLVGGVETLFKDSAATVLKYSRDAYITAGLSANQYMETVTSFSASLLQSLGNDTAAATEYANTAIIDMSDNANKMGTDISMIQNAYQGFAKQNYTMLDNLKLGYGGTKEEMQRLIDEANRINKAQGKNTEYTIKSYADIVDAIHTVQTEMGITGTTAKEASTTIQGSLASAKSAWSNLVIGISDDTQDFQALVNNFTNSVSTAAKNILPRISTALAGIGNLITGLSPVISSALPMLVTSVLPSLLKSGVSLVSALASGIITALPALLTTAKDLLLTIITGLTENQDQMIETAINIIGVLVTGLFEAIPELLAAAGNLIVSFVGAIGGHFPEILALGGAIILTIGEGISYAFAQFFWAVYRLFEMLWTEIRALAENAADVIAEKWQNFKDKLSEIVESVRENVVEKFEEIKNKTKEKIENMVSSAKAKFEDMKANLKEKVDGIKSDVVNKFQEIKDGITEKIETARDKVHEAIEKIKSFFDFEWELPQIKLPHFKKVGTTALGLPEIVVKWYAKGGVLEKPTIFGMNGNALMGGGEAGKEAVAPIDVLQGYVAEAVAAQNNGVVAALERILDTLMDIDENMGGNLREALDGTALKINNREFGRLVRTVNV